MKSGIRPVHVAFARSGREPVVDQRAVVERRLRDLEPLAPHDAQVLDRVEAVHLDVLVPQEDVLVLCRQVRVQEPLGEPPLGLVAHGDVDRAVGPPEVSPPVDHAIVVEQHHLEVGRGELHGQHNTVRVITLLGGVSQGT
jgi:hypothetical protein